ncbi:Helix-turn-helix domain protein [compost metagenome]
MENKEYLMTGSVAPLTSQTTALIHLALNLWNGYKFDLAEGLSFWDQDLCNVAFQAIDLRRGTPFFKPNITSCIDYTTNTVIKESESTSSHKQNDQTLSQNTLTFLEVWDTIFQRKVSKDKLYKEIREGRIPHFRIGTKIYFRKDTLNAYLQQEEIKSLR